MNARSARLVGVDLGGTAIKAGALGANGEVLERRSVPAEHERGADHVARRIADLARDLGCEGTLGIGSPGLLDRDAGVVLESPNLKALEGAPLRGLVAKELELPEERVFLENDANVAALGEAWLGAAAGRRDVMVLTLGTGIGSGLILDGELFLGPGRLAAEFGHILADPNGPLCGCGAPGCIEALASATAARRRAIEAGLPAEQPGDLELLTARAREAAGPERDLCEAIGLDLGRAFSTVVSLLDLRCFVIGGGFGAALDVLQPGIQRGLSERIFGSRVEDISILPASLGPDAGWIGAASLGA